MSEQPEQRDVDAQIENYMREILKLLDIKKEEVLKETPRRFCKLLKQRTSSNRTELDPSILTTFPMEKPGLVIVKDLDVRSICEHHLMPFSGKAVIAYLPKKEVLGLSKLQRIVSYHCKKDQLQEALSQEIMETMSKAVDSDGICVLMKCKHFCMILNDEVNSPAETVTVLKSGKFETDPVLFQNVMDSLKI
jgi:GTP cyclohydrolase I